MFFMFFSWIGGWTFCVVDLSKIGNREKLKPRAGDEPHWQRLRAGAYLGYRPSKRQGPGKWFARAYDPDTEKYRRKALGDYGTLTGHDVFGTARRDAEAWAEQIESGGIRAEKIETVADACRSYLQQRPGSIAEGVFRRHVFDDPIAGVKLDKLRRHHLREWRNRLKDAPALVSRSTKGPKRTKVRSSSTINRDMVPLRAALGRLLTPGAPNTDAAWQEALRPIKGADKRRELYLDRNERMRLLQAADEAVVPFMRALCILPLRPGALASLKASHFDARTRTLTIGKDKTGRPRQISVPETVAKFLEQQCLGRLPKAPMFSRADGREWTKDSWKGPIKDAAAGAKLPQAVAAYTLRHSVLTDLIRDGLPVLTVAQLSGTSVAMIERHYGHLVRRDAEDALARLAL
ncbi:tyrosine-type recombinase/integrase [Aurantiacibacter luteus]|uniref:tyrosine-type recombinase/integrase n=1 Tax=Aurantiacibacter luteus TaxID=1581420 RepID=UPI001F4D348D|nr:tyrosine-type recombinase/integrase [Aurantiacibacter luteus]